MRTITKTKTYRYDDLLPEAKKYWSKTDIKKLMDLLRDMEYASVTGENPMDIREKITLENLLKSKL